MGDKVRGALNQIDWSKSNQVSINVDKKRQQKPISQPPPSSRPASRTQPSPAASSLNSSGGDIPINQYRSVVAPVKSGKDSERPAPRRASADNGRRRNSERLSVASEEDEDSAQIYLGYLGSLRVPADGVSTGIHAIQNPMTGLYFPYREKKVYAQERVISVIAEGLEVYYLPDPELEEPTSFIIRWEDILYVEPLRFTTKKTGKDKKSVVAAFEPCEAQRLTMLGNRDSLFAPLSKQHKHISLLRHPALLCLVVRSPHTQNELFTHGYICSTVDESVFLARQVRDELEVLHREFLKSGQQPPSLGGFPAGQMSMRSDRYVIKENTDRGTKLKLKSKKKLKRKDERAAFTMHTGNDAEDLGTFHFGVPLSSYPNSTHSQSHSFDDDSPINDNFVIGHQGRQPSNHRHSYPDTFADFDRQSEISSRSGHKPVGVVQPQASATFKVLPSDVQMDRSQLKPTALNIKSNKYSDVTPELDLKLRMRQQDDSAPMLSSMAPRTVVNPLADVEPELNRKSFLSSTPGPITKMTSSLPFNPTAALPHSGWHEPVLGNFKSKEKIDNRLNSQMVDAKELPKLESDKKEQEMANLFSNIDLNVLENQETNNNFIMRPGTTNEMHDALGFMP